MKRPFFIAKVFHQAAGRFRGRMLLMPSVSVFAIKVLRGAASSEIPM